MRKVAVVCILLLVSLAGAETLLERVNGALDAGEITADQAALYLAAALDGDRAAPGTLMEGVDAEPCGTPAIERLEELYDSCSAPVREEVRGLLARPTLSGPEYTYDSPEGWFKMHWTDEGADATSESYVQALAEAFDWSWEHQCLDMGFEEPPSDLGLGGDEKLDVYMISLGGGTIGWCSTAGNPTNPGGYPNSVSSHIAMEADSSEFGMDQMNETASHEFQHAVQNAYAAVEPSWFKENCATWMQNECWDTDLYADYLGSGENCLRQPWRAMDSGSMYHYGATPWPMYMQVRCGGYEVVRQVWYNCAIVSGMNTWPAIETTAEEYGMTITQWFAEYAAWRWFTGNFAVPSGFYEYEESSLWSPGPRVLPWQYHTSLPASGDQGDYSDYYPDHTGLHWIRVVADDYQDGWMDFSFDGRDNFDWTVGYIQYAEDQGAFGWQYVDNSSATCDFSVSANGWDDVVFFVFANMDSSLDHLFEYSIDYSTGVAGGEVADNGLAVVPEANPMAPGMAIAVTTPEAGFTTLNVHDLSGRLVDRVAAQELTAGTHSLQWSAESLQSGVYFLRLTGPTGGVTRKVVLQR